MFEFTDQLGTILKLKEKPKRIISIVPSQSEFLWDIGLYSELVGITKFCIHPNKMFKSVDRVGGTKKLNIEKIRALKPDLIIGNKEENEKSDIDLLKKEFNVWMSDIYTIEDSFNMMKMLGAICDKEIAANNLVEEIEKSLGEIEYYFAGQKVAYFIWNKPYMFAAKNTFIDSVLNFVGFNNALFNLERYPELTDEQLKLVKLDFCFLSSEPFPFKEKHVAELQKKLPTAKIIIVDGELFSWYGTRLLHLNAYIKDLKKRINA
ncbi:MAG: helical backbone metal receptor [Bacteroidota bacterium]|nr:helical backbone metal receptor [Bacteroidota bacterium]MDP3145317.1 helical backbone metal receptor [Bacteroidota bacterium]